MRTVSSCILALIAPVAVAACGGSTTGAVSVPQVPPARTYSLQNFQPATPILPDHLTTLSFRIEQPSGKPLTQYRACCDPHAGVDLIIVRADDSNVQYDDSTIAPNGTIYQPVRFATPGRYRIIIDAYPAHAPAGQPINFQLFTWVRVEGRHRPQPIPSYRASEAIGGYRFTIKGHPRLAAIQAAFLTVKVTGPNGRPAMFGTWHGALAHAIFIHQGSLAYSHTHVCGAGAMYCTSVAGATRVTGSSTQPGILHVGVLLPVPGTWRLFLLTYINGRHITVPFTLEASA